MDKIAILKKDTLDRNNEEDKIALDFAIENIDKISKIESCFDIFMSENKEYDIKKLIYDIKAIVKK